MPIEPVMPVKDNPVTETARRCVEIAMERCRVLNNFAIAITRLGRPEVANRLELKAHQFEWIADAIRREFGIKETL